MAAAGGAVAPSGTVVAMARVHPRSVAVLCAVTLFIWGNRIWLAWTNEGDTLARKLTYSVPITAFVIAAGILAVALLSGVDRSTRWFGGLVQALSLGTVLYWAIRLPMILAADHDVPFKAVHAVLALASAAAAIWAWRTARVGYSPDGDAANEDGTAGGRAGAGDGGGRLRV